jgi:cell division protease FtsH
VPLHKVTIIPRGMALGITSFLPETEQLDFSKEEAESQIAVATAGRIADELFCHTKTAGARNDIEQATGLARRMVCEWGMSELGPLSFGKKEEQIFLGREINQHRDYSESTAIRIDEEVQKIVMRGYERARDIIETHREAMERIADELLVREVLDAEQVKRIIAGQALSEPEPVQPPASPVESVSEDGRRPRPAVVQPLPINKPLPQE